MVASAVLSLIVVLLVQVAGMVSNTWSQGQGRTERSQNGRALVDFIGRELRSAALPVDSRSTGNTPDLQFVVNPAGVPASTGSLRRCSGRLRSPLPRFTETWQRSGTSSAGMTLPPRRGPPCAGSF
ncbi:hypothetical protein [Verrucomicrobium spinosum]|uniref:hypothetical protein n=1 Tax=Verrucomicrobium spinosum TaxID=2736 RepID=UPI0009461C68|nr:hypothetical protein [Verrucomicrobium spinosum]